MRWPTTTQSHVNPPANHRPQTIPTLLFHKDLAHSVTPRPQSSQHHNNLPQPKFTANHAYVAIATSHHNEIIKHSQNSADLKPNRTTPQSTRTPRRPHNQTSPNPSATRLSELTTQNGRQRLPSITRSTITATRATRPSLLALERIRQNEAQEN